MWFLFYSFYHATLLDDCRTMSSLFEFNKIALGDIRQCSRVTGVKCLNDAIVEINWPLSATMNQTLLRGDVSSIFNLKSLEKLYVIFLKKSLKFRDLSHQSLVTGCLNLNNAPRLEYL